MGELERRVYMLNDFNLSRSDEGLASWRQHKHSRQGTRKGEKNHRTDPQKHLQNGTKIRNFTPLVWKFQKKVWMAKTLSY